MKVKYRLIYNRRKKLHKDGKAFVLIECYLDRKRKYINVGIKIKPDEWNKKKGFINNKNKNYIKLNVLLQKKINELEEFELEYLRKNKIFRLDYFVYFEKNKNNDDNFINFCKIELEKQTHFAKITNKSHKNFIKYLSEFNNNIYADDIDYKFLADFDSFLFNKKLHTNTVGNHHKKLRKYLNIAVKYDLIKKNPYKKFKIKKEKSERTFLTIQEINKIEKIEFPKKSNNLEIIRDIFLFSCFTGLRYSDMQGIQNKDIVIENDNMNIRINQRKTNEVVYIPLTIIFDGKAENIIKKHYSEDNEHVFPRLTNQYVNKMLKAIAVIAQIDKELSFHISRHSFGTNLAKYTNDAFLIKKLMGHQDINTSLIYIHLSESIIDEKLKNVKWK